MIASLLAMHVVAGSCPVDGLRDEDVRTLLQIELARLAPLPDDMSIFVDVAHCERATAGALIVIDRESGVSARSWIALDDVAKAARARTTALAVAEIVRQLLALPSRSPFWPIAKTATGTVTVPSAAAAPAAPDLSTAFGPSFRTFLIGSPMFGGYGSFTLTLPELPLRGELILSGHRGWREHELGDIELTDLSVAWSVLWIFQGPRFEFGAGAQLEGGAVFARGHSESSEVIPDSRAALFAGASLELALKVWIVPKVSAEIAVSGGGALGGLAISADDVYLGRLGGWMAGARTGLRFEL